MKSKSNTLSPTVQPLISGLDKNSNTIEFYGLPETKQVMWLQGGHAYTWEELPTKHFVTLLNAYNSDRMAKAILPKVVNSENVCVTLSVTRRVELYTYYCYGSLNHHPDMVDGVLQAPENYRHEKECISLQFENKDMTLNGEPLKPREIIMLDLFAQDQKDEVVAIELGITRTTLNNHKKTLFQKAGVFSKPALMIKAMYDQVIQTAN